MTDKQIREAAEELMECLWIPKDSRYDYKLVKVEDQLRKLIAACNKSDGKRPI